jgi:YD repeat-containing protein
MAKHTRRTFLAAVLALPTCLLGKKLVPAAAPAAPPATPVPPCPDLADSAGTTTVYRYDAWGRLTSIQDPLSPVVTYVYDCTGKLLSEPGAPGPGQPPNA